VLTRDDGFIITSSHNLAESGLSKVPLLYVYIRVTQRCGALRQIKIIYELKKGNPRDSVDGPYWTWLGKGSG
jgi:hypothetical protein